MSLGSSSFDLNQFSKLVLQSGDVTRCDLCSKVFVRLYSQRCYFDSLLLPLGAIASELLVINCMLTMAQRRDWTLSMVCFLQAVEWASIELQPATSAMFSLD